MKTIKPDYYQAFHCIADKCTFTCCQEWKIAVDDKTEEKWKKYPDPHQKSKMLCEVITEKDDTRIIGLNGEKKCPFLNENKLCKLVVEYGEEILSETCHTFPRQVHHFQSENSQGGWTEYSLVACCPAVIDIWMEQEEIKWVEDITETREDENKKTAMEPVQERETDICLAIREKMFFIMKNKANSNEKNLLLLFFMLLDLEEVYLNEKIADRSNDEPKSQWRKLWNKLQGYNKNNVMTQLSEKIDQMEFSAEDTFVERNELFLDMIENYRKEGIYKRHLDEIALLAETISEEMFVEDRELEDIFHDEEIPLWADLKEFQKEIQPYESLFRNFLVSEIFTNVLIPGGDLESMILMTQWMAMEYAVMQHAIFLRWYLDDEKKLTYERIRDYMVLCARITGYDQEDICEYMENSFESVLWDWGYFALLIGDGKSI